MVTQIAIYPDKDDIKILEYRLSKITDKVRDIDPFLMQVGKSIKSVTKQRLKNLEATAPPLSYKYSKWKRRCGGGRMLGLNFPYRGRDNEQLFKNLLGTGGRESGQVSSRRTQNVFEVSYGTNDPVAAWMQQDPVMSYVSEDMHAVHGMNEGAIRGPKGVPSRQFLYIEDDEAKAIFSQVENILRGAFS